jgi:hypothetical protein
MKTLDSNLGSFCEKEGGTMKRSMKIKPLTPFQTAASTAIFKYPRVPA